MSINPSNQTGTKKISSEGSSLNPSTLITLYEFDLRNFGINRDNIDLAELSFADQIQIPYNDAGNLPNYDSTEIDSPLGILRFHNLTINFENTSSNLSSPVLFNQIIWQGKRYVPFPILIEGFEMMARGTLPKPKLTFASQNQIEAYDNFFTQIKNTIRSIGDIIGLEIIRKRTYLKYLDAVNFKSYGGIINDDNFIIDPDPYAQLNPDIFYVDRKLKENKNILQYELSSILDLENIRLPLRTLYSEACSFEYRGEGCGYSETLNPYSGRLNQGKPIADSKDDDIATLLGVSLTEGSPVIWQKSNGASYSKGNYVYVEIDDIKYYFVPKINNNLYSPYNINYWIADQCSKRLKGCRKRFSSPLPFGGFPATSKEI
jgi:lambda family phage minor tail protein L